MQYTECYCSRNVHYTQHTLLHVHSQWSDNATSNNMDIIAQLHSEMQQQARKFVFGLNSHTQTHIYSAQPVMQLHLFNVHTYSRLCCPKGQHVHNTDRHSHRTQQKLNFPERSVAESILFTYVEGVLLCCLELKPHILAETE